MFIKFVFIIVCFVVTMGNACAQPNQYIRSIADDFDNKLNRTERVELDSDSAEYIKRLSKFSDSVEYELKTLYFAEKTLWQLYDDAVAMVHKKSEQTGREVKTRESQDEQTGKKTMYVGLDWGDYEECELTLCESYPADFERCFVNMEYSDVSNEVFSAMLFFNCDNKKENRINNVSFIVNANGDNGQSSEKHVLSYVLSVIIAGSEQNYDEFYQNKNDMLTVRRANLAEKQKYKNKAMIMEEPLSPEADVFQVNFTSVINQM